MAVLDLLGAVLGAPLESIEQLFATGGLVLWAIFAAAMVMWSLIVERWWYFRRQFPQTRLRLRREWQQRGDRRSWNARQIRSMLISQAQVEMSAGVQVMGSIVPLCPLLGLVGTVVGMMEVFDAMSLRGRVDPQTLSGGISKAMIATLAGLAVSLSGMGFVQYFRGRVRRETESLNDWLAPGEERA